MDKKIIESALVGGSVWFGHCTEHMLTATLFRNRTPMAHAASQYGFEHLFLSLAAQYGKDEYEINKLREQHPASAPPGKQGAIEQLLNSSNLVVYTNNESFVAECFKTGAPGIAAPSGIYYKKATNKTIGLALADILDKREFRLVDEESCMRIVI